MKRCLRIGHFEGEEVLPEGTPVEVETLTAIEDYEIGVDAVPVGVGWDVEETVVGPGF